VITDHGKRDRSTVLGRRGEFAVLAVEAINAWRYPTPRWRWSAAGWIHQGPSRDLRDNLDLRRKVLWL
jgi:hypothetical protein